VTDIDPGAEISIGRCYDVDQDHERDHLVVRIPLAERVDQDWIRWYQRLARVKGISARRRSSGGKQRQDRCSRLRCARSHPRVAGYPRASSREASAALEKPPPIDEAE